MLVILILYALPSENILHPNHGGEVQHRRAHSLLNTCFTLSVFTGDATRVTISMAPGKEGSDFINANYLGVSTLQSVESSGDYFSIMILIHRGSIIGCFPSAVPKLENRSEGALLVQIF